MDKFWINAEKAIKKGFLILFLTVTITSLVVGKCVDTPVNITSTQATTAKETEADVTTQALSLGEFRITVYTPYCDGGKWGYQTATGVKSEGLKTCAVDPSVIPLGTTILVDGICLKTVDTGSAVKGNVIDIFYDGTKKEATEWLSQVGTVHEVYEVK